MIGCSALAVLGLKAVPDLFLVESFPEGQTLS